MQKPLHLPPLLLDLLTNSSIELIRGCASSLRGIEIIRGCASSIRCITTLKFLTDMVESTPSENENALTFVCLVALHRVLDKDMCSKDKEPYASLLEKMGLDREFHSSKQIPLFMQNFEGIDKDLYIRLADYAKQLIEYSGCPIDKLSMDNAHEIAILTFVLTYWSTFFHSCFNAEMFLDELWRIYKQVHTFTGEHDELCCKYPDMFLYMYDVMKKKHEGCDETEKENAWRLWENTKSMCQNLGFIPDPEWPEYTGEEAVEDDCKYLGCND
jgi:hypothetical protein